MQSQLQQCLLSLLQRFFPQKSCKLIMGRNLKGHYLFYYGSTVSKLTQGLVEQASGVVEAKLRAWKMDNGSTEWADGLLEVTLAMNTQEHSTIGCAPAELLFRERMSYIDWLNRQKRNNMNIGVAQEDRPRNLL
jgi:hypothetical protein